MLGAIIGDIVGSRFEFHPTNDYDFELITKECSFTDDTICTIAIADALMEEVNFGKSLHEWCRKYPNPKGGYGGRFREWIMSNKPKPYNSFGNGSAMRVSPVAWAYRDLGEANILAKKSAECTHNHPEGIKGAQAVVTAIHYGYELRKRSETIVKDCITKAFQPIIESFGYNINIRHADVLNKFDETCQGTVPVALWIITESNGFEDAIRKAVSLGVDADTLGAIVGSIAEAIWGVPTGLALEAMRYLPDEMKDVVLRFYRKYEMAKEIFPLNGYGDEGAAEDLLADEEDEDVEDAEYNQFKTMMLWKLGLGNMARYFAGENPLPKKEKATTAASWEIQEMPTGKDEVSTIEIHIPVSLEKMEILRMGHLPDAQEDHWFMYCTEDTIRYYRSWTGMCAFIGHFHKENGCYIIDKLEMNHGLREFGVNGDEHGLRLFHYLILAEQGYASKEAWIEFIINQWGSYKKHSQKKPKPAPIKKIADPWFTGIYGKVCEGCIYCGGIRRWDDSLEKEIMGCGRYIRETFKTSYESGKCKFRKTDLWIPSEFELERKAETLRRIKEKEEAKNRNKSEHDSALRSCVILKKTYAAGTQFVNDKKALKNLGMYTKLELVRECDNKHDENAVSLYYEGKHVGYVPRRENKELAAMLEAGMCERLLTFVTGISGTGSNMKYEFTTYLIPDALSNKMVLEDTEYFWAGKMYEKLETMRGSSEFSTSEFWHEVAEEYLQEHDVQIRVPDFWKLHNIFVTLVTEDKYKIIGSDLPEGLPFNITNKYVRIATESDDYEVIEVKRKPRKCPICGGEVFEIIHGMPMCSEEEYYRRYGKRVIFRGCGLRENDPEWACIDCKQEFKKK